MSNYSFDKKDIFTVLNCEEAETYIGKKGYLGNSLSDLETAIVRESAQILTKVVSANVEAEPFFAYFMKSDYHSALFLPAEKVKKSQKKLRPFTSFVEFQKTTGAGIGSALTWRAKGASAVLTTLITSVMFADGSDSYESVITLGDDNFTFDSLFNDYEYQGSADNWRPFGIEAEVEE